MTRTLYVVTAALLMSIATVGAFAAVGLGDSESTASTSYEMSEVSDVSELPQTDALFLARTDEGRSFLKYAASCALGEGQSLSFSVDGVEYEYEGALGFAPEWLERDMTSSEERWLSACLLAHVNGLGEHVPISVRATTYRDMEEKEARIFTVHEGAFFGSFGAATGYACMGDPADVATQMSSWREVRVCTDGYDDCMLQAVGSCESVCSEYEDGIGWTECEVGGQSYTEVVNVFLQTDRLPAEEW